MNLNTQKVYQWAVIGAGPAGIATVGLLIDAGIDPNEIIWFDPYFQVGDFGRCWGEVSSNTSVKLFLEFLTKIKAFSFENRSTRFTLEALPLEGFTYLKEVTKPLQRVTQDLRKKVANIERKVNKMYVSDGYWNIQVNDGIYFAEKTVLATGSEAKSLNINHPEKINLSDALNPSKLKQCVESDDAVAVFGSSHSAMIIIRNLLDAGVSRIFNFYLSPLRYAIPMKGWTLYDNSGLKGETAIWVKQNISKDLNPKVQRYISTKDNINKHLRSCKKAIYAIGFEQRSPQVENVDPKNYDTSYGIIAPGLFGVGIGFPRKVTDPNGNQELNVGLWKFMNDIRAMLPLWMGYGL